MMIRFHTLHFFPPTHWPERMATPCENVANYFGNLKIFYDQSMRTINDSDLDRSAIGES